MRRFQAFMAGLLVLARESIWERFAASALFLFLVACAALVVAGFVSAIHALRWLIFPVLVFGLSGCSVVTSRTGVTVGVSSAVAGPAGALVYYLMRAKPQPFIEQKPQPFIEQKPQPFIEQKPQPFSEQPFADVSPFVTERKPQRELKSSPFPPGDESAWEWIGEMQIREFCEGFERRMRP